MKQVNDLWGTLRRGAENAQEGPLTAKLKEAGWAFGAIAIFSFLLNLLYLASPLYMMQIYDRVLGSGERATLLLLFIIAVACVGVLGFLDALRARLLTRISAWFHEHLSEDVAKASLKSTLVGQSVGANPLRDLSIVQGFVSGQGVKSLLDAPWTPIFLLAIFVMHWTLGLVTLGAAIVILALAVFNERLTRQSLKEGAGAQAGAHDVIEVSLRNAEAIHAMGMTPAVIRRFRVQNDHALNKSATGEELGAMVAGATKALRMMIQMVMLGAGALLVLDGKLSGGAMIAGSILLGRALAPVENAIGVWKQFVVARDAHQRLRKLLMVYAENPDPMALPEPVGELSVEDIIFAPQDSAAPILKNISFEVAPGEALAILGPSASGKSTLCRVVSGVWKPSKGCVRIDGADLHQRLSEDVGRYLGYVPQSVELFSGPVRENIARLSEGDPHKIIKAAMRAGVHDMILRLPKGYDTEIGAGGARLSAGQRQRLALARALYGDPKLLIMDEPNSNLDQDGETALAAAIEAAKNDGTAVIMVAHRPSALSCVDRILCLRNGATDLYGPRDEVLNALIQRRRKQGDLTVIGNEAGAGERMPERQVAHKSAPQEKSVGGPKSAAPDKGQGGEAQSAASSAANSGALEPGSSAAASSASVGKGAATAKKNGPQQGAQGAGAKSKPAKAATAKARGSQTSPSKQKTAASKPRQPKADLAKSAASGEAHSDKPDIKREAI